MFEGIPGKVTLFPSGDVVNLANLWAGISVFLDKGFDATFHDSLYRQLHSRRQQDRLTWSFLVDQLAVWKALRSSMPGRDKSYYLGRGPDYFPRLKEQLASITRTHGGRVPDLLELDPSELTEMFDIAKKIKGADSPVFASKLCHFVLPSAFPVTDNTMLGKWGRDYWAYWQRCADGWRDCPDRELLKRELGKRIPGGAAPCYPWGTKIGELCHWGARPG